MLVGGSGNRSDFGVAFLGSSSTMNGAIRDTMRAGMCLRVKPWFRRAVLICIAALACAWACAQTLPAPASRATAAAPPQSSASQLPSPTSAAPQTPAVQPAPATEPLDGEAPAAASAADDTAAAADTAPPTASSEAKPAPSAHKPRRRRLTSEDTPLAPRDPNSNRGTTHQDPILLVGLVAAGLYHRRKRDLRDDDEWIRRAHYEPLRVPPLPQSFQMTNYSWTASVPGAGIVLQIGTPVAPEPRPTAPRVLLVGGDRQWIRLVNDTLTADGAELQVCHAGQRAVDLLLYGRFDAIICDAEATGDNSPATIHAWLVRHRAGMERRLIVTVKNNCSPETDARLERIRALRLIRPCAAQDLQVMVRLAVQRRCAADPKQRIPSP